MKESDITRAVHALLRADALEPTKFFALGRENYSFVEGALLNSRLPEALRIHAVMLAVRLRWHGDQGVLFDKLLQLAVAPEPRLRAAAVRAVVGLTSHARNSKTAARELPKARVDVVQPVLAEMLAMGCTPALQTEVTALLR